MRLSTGFWASKTLFAAHTLDVFGVLSDRGGATPAELAKPLGSPSAPPRCCSPGAPASVCWTSATAGT
jgi:hypothetical protein